MSDDPLTVQFSTREARAVHSAASMFSQMVSEMNPEWETHLEDDGLPAALRTGLLALEMTLALVVEP